MAQAPAALVLFAVIGVSQLASAYLAGRITGLSARASIGHGLMLLPRGEFSLVVVGVAASAEAIEPATRSALQGMVSLYVLLSVVAASAALARYDRINSYVERVLGGRSARLREAERARSMGDVTLE